MCNYELLKGRTCNQRILTYRSGLFGINMGRTPSLISFDKFLEYYLNTQFSKIDNYLSKYFHAYRTNCVIISWENGLNVTINRIASRYNLCRCILCRCELFIEGFYNCEICRVYLVFRAINIFVYFEKMRWVKDQLYEFLSV